MKYMLMVYTNPKDWAEWDNPSEEFQATHEFMNKLNEELIANGEMVDGAGLSDPALARTVRRRGDGAVTTDGPYAETKEVFGGFWILDLDSYDRAVEIATRVVEFGHRNPQHIEIRPIMAEDEATVGEHVTA